MPTSPREKQNVLYQLNAAVIAGAVREASVERPSTRSFIRFSVSPKLARD